MNDDESALDRAKRELLFASLSDIQGSVHENDSKANAALIVHGLLFAGVTTVLTRLGRVYVNSTTFERVMGIILLSVALLAFLRSVWCVLRALSPYRNKDLVTALESRRKRVFFPDLAGRARKGTECPLNERFSTLDNRFKELNSGERVAAELMGEIIMLDDIHCYESKNTDRGYRALRVEVTAVGLFLVLVGVAALG